MTVPIYLVGDGWQLPSGLGRIARDLSSVLEIPQIGYHPAALLVSGNGSQYTFTDLAEDWGASCVVRFLGERHHPHRPGVLLIVWDPSRAIHYLQPMRQFFPGWELWGYFAVDGHNPHGLLGGPLAEAVQQFDRVLAYTQYGAEVLGKIRRKPVDWLPHGIMRPVADTFDEQRTQLRVFHGQQLIPRFTQGDYLLGCVATNQARKDLQLFVQTVARLREKGERVYGWLHTDVLVRHWSIPELLGFYGVGKYIRVTTDEMTDYQLMQYYRACAATICVGRGEGFGYPIVESLACGTPCLAMGYAGGAELTPPQWRYGYQAVDYTNLYLIGRPLANAEELVEKIGHIRFDQLDGGDQELSAYCRGAVAHLGWDYLKPRWQQWLRQGLEEA